MTRTLPILPLLLVGFLPSLLSTTATAQTTHATASTSTCDFGGPAYAAYCEHDTGNLGFLGSGSFGAVGEHNNGHFGYLGGGSYGAYGQHQAGPYGYLGGGTFGAYGQHSTGNAGYLGGIGSAVYGKHNNGNVGALASDTYAVFGFAPPLTTDFAGYFSGKVQVTGTLSKGGGSFKIDHPLDPANRYLSHSFVESPDMMNVYNGNTTTDAEGFATVTLPDYFEVLNRDFRYQLTVIGVFARAIVAEKIQANQFVIRTDQPGVEVSWQVTGIRQDAWAEANRVVVEAAKPAEERGYYLHPWLYGQPDAQRIGWVEEDTAAVQGEVDWQRIDQERRPIERARRRIPAERERFQTRRERPLPRPGDHH